MWSAPQAGAVSEGCPGGIWEGFRGKGALGFLQVSTCPSVASSCLGPFPICPELWPCPGVDRVQRPKLKVPMAPGLPHPCFHPAPGGQGQDLLAENLLGTSVPLYKLGAGQLRVEPRKKWFEAAGHMVEGGGLGPGQWTAGGSSPPTLSLQEAGRVCGAGLAL